MRETTGRHGRVSTKLKAAFIALLAIFAVSAIGVTNAQAAEQLDLEFNDSWIKVDSLVALTGGGIHALDPTDTSAPKIKLKAALSPDGSFNGKAADFNFPDQNIDASSANMGTITLRITAAGNYSGNYNKTSGALTGVLPLNLTVDAPDALGGMKCQISPLNINLNTSGAGVDFGSEEEPNVKTPAPFTGGQGQIIGKWTGVTIENVVGIAAYGKTATEMTGDCQTLIGALIGQADSFDGSIWLSGKSTVTQVADPVCTPPQTGTPPNCQNPVNPTPFKASKVALSPKKGSVKAGKKIKIKVSVTNSGETAGSATVALKSSNKKVTLPKSVKISVGAGATATKTITVKASKKAKGKANITAKSGSLSAKAVITVKKAKKK